ncbi:MAG: peptidylprolyl isomerase [Chitinophagales bacterium]|nr:peptidylprolyl isomerase [Chitinophagales bacterium]
MSIITELRKRSWIVLVFIALALVSFLLMDAFNSNRSVLNNNKTEFASINGQEVTPLVYDQQYQDALLQYLTQTRNYTNAKYGQFQLDNAQEFQLHEQAWTTYLNETLINEQIEKIGITITQEEIDNLVYGADPHPYIKNYYSALSPDGRFDPSALANYYQQISNQEIWQQNPQAEEEYYNFVMREKLAKRDYIQSKYTALFTKADYVPVWMAKRDYEVKNRRATFDYTDIPYTTVPDSTVEISDKEMRDYFERNKNKFKQKEESRIIDFITWNFIPTATDSAAILASLYADIEKMKVAKSDSTYIALHSEDPSRISNVYTGRTELYDAGIDSSIVDSIFTKPVGSLIGPFFSSDGYYKAVSVRNRKNLPDSVDVRHILISMNETRDSVAAKNIADSLLTALTNGSSFDTLAMNYSDDTGSGADGGNLGWTTPATNFVKPFKDYVFETGKTGENGLVKTEFGYHIIQIKEKKNPKDFVQIYYLSKIIEPSTATTDSVNTMASEFYETYNTTETFKPGAEEKKLLIRTSQPLNKNQQELPGLPDTRGIITWSFGAEKDEFNLFNSMVDKVVLAYVKEIKPEGIPDLEDVEEQVKLEAIREKKGVMLAQKMEDALSGGADLQTIAQKVGSNVKNSPNASLATPYAQNLGLEPKVVGTVMGTEQGKQTKVIQGTRGVYVAVVAAITEPAPTEDYTLNLNQLKAGLRTRLGGQNVLTNLVDKAEIVDNRFMF